MRIQYPVIGRPLLSGCIHEIRTLRPSSEIVKGCIYVGADAETIERALDNSPSPWTLRANTLNEY